MSRQGVPIGKLFGIQIILDYSWFPIALLFSWSLAQNYYPSRFAGWSDILYYVMGTITALSLFGSVLLHEYGHSLTARGFGIPVKRIRLMIFGGLAELGDESPHAGAEFWVAIMGPVVSVVTGVLSFAIWLGLRVTMGLPLEIFGINFGAAPIQFIEPVLALEAIMSVFGYLALINILLAVFNMLPGFPLDGGRVFRAALWGILKDYDRATRIAVGVGRALAFLFIGWGVLRMVTGNFFGGLWTVFIGIFMQSAARNELRMQSLKSVLEKRQIAHLMMHNPRIQRWASPEAQRVISPDADALAPDMNLWVALKEMEKNELRYMPVRREGQLLGVVQREDIFGYLRVLQL